MKKYTLFISLLTSTLLSASDNPEKTIATKENVHVTLNAQVIHIHFHQNQNNIDVNKHTGLWFTPKAVAKFRNSFNQYKRFKRWRRSKL